MKSVTRRGVAKKKREGKSWSEETEFLSVKLIPAYKIAM